MKPCLHIWVQLKRSLKKRSRIWRSRCQSGSALIVGGTWCWRKRGRETGKARPTAKKPKTMLLQEQKDAFCLQNIPINYTPTAHLLQVRSFFGSVSILFHLVSFYLLSLSNSCFILIHPSTTNTASSVLSTMCLSPCSKYLSCVGFPACKTAVWFPDTALEVSRDNSVCSTCQPHPVHM